MMIWRPNSAVEGGIHDLRARACSAARSDRKPASHPDHGRHAEVEEKRKRLRKQKPRKIGAFIGHHMIPVVLGPKSATTSRKLDSAILVMKAAKDRL